MNWEDCYVDPERAAETISELRDELADLRKAFKARVEMHRQDTAKLFWYEQLPITEINGFKVLVIPKEDV